MLEGKETKEEETVKCPALPDGVLVNLANQKRVIPHSLIGTREKEEEG